MVPGGAERDVLEVVRHSGIQMHLYALARSLQVRRAGQLLGAEILQVLHGSWLVRFGRLLASGCSGRGGLGFGSFGNARPP